MNTQRSDNRFPCRQIRAPVHDILLFKGSFKAGIKLRRSLITLPGLYELMTTLALLNVYFIVPSRKLRIFVLFHCVLPIIYLASVFASVISLLRLATVFFCSFAHPPVSPVKLL